MKTKVLIIVLFGVLNNSSFAFRAIGHVLLKDKIVANYNGEKNPFIDAMKKHPQIAAWGSIGPDLGYNVDFSRFFNSKFTRQMKNSMQSADLAHYHLVGTFTKALIDSALASKNDKFLAFVGGWMTHIAGDFGSHGIYVKPEAGFYISYEGGRGIHGDLEKLADAYLYDEFAKDYCKSGRDFHPQNYWKDFFGVYPKPNGKDEKNFNECSLDTMLGKDVSGMFTTIYSRIYDIREVNFTLDNLAKRYYRAVGLGLGKITGELFIQYSIENMNDLVLLKTRKHLIDSAFLTGIAFGTKLLVNSISKDKGMFSDKWNLDIGENGAPTYVVKICAGEKMTSRTKNELWTYLIDKNKSSSTEVNLTPNIKIWTFTFYQKDTYYYCFNMGGAMGELNCWKKENVESLVLFLRKRKRQFFKNTFRMKEITVYYDGGVVSKMLPPLRKTDPGKPERRKKHIKLRGKTKLVLMMGTTS